MGEVGRCEKVGFSVGFAVGEVGLIVGTIEIDGAPVGTTEGILEGLKVGTADGHIEGLVVGKIDGNVVG